MVDEDENGDIYRYQQMATTKRDTGRGPGSQHSSFPAKPWLPWSYKASCDEQMDPPLSFWLFGMRVGPIDVLKPHESMKLITWRVFPPSSFRYETIGADTCDTLLWWCSWKDYPMFLLSSHVQRNTIVLEVWTIQREGQSLSTGIEYDTIRQQSQTQHLLILRAWISRGWWAGQ